MEKIKKDIAELESLASKVNVCPSMEMAIIKLHEDFDKAYKHYKELVREYTSAREKLDVMMLKYLRTLQKEDK